MPQVIGDLTMDPENALCGKKKDAALELKRQGNQCFLNGDYANALVYYSKVSNFILLDDYLELLPCCNGKNFPVCEKGA